jgi:hypothetical protein
MTDLSGWTARQLPDGRALAGRLVRLERLDPDRHGASLGAHLSGPGTADLYAYLADPVPAGAADVAAWAQRVAPLADPFFYAVVDVATGHAVGRLSLMRVDPANGVIEVGLRPYLARQDAREIRVYETTDLAIDPPDWELGKTIQRRNSDEVIGELVKMIVTHCEPDAFLPAPATRIDEETGRVVPRQHTTPPGERKEEGPRRRNPNTGATANFKPEEAQVFVNGRWASIQMKDNNLAVLAPDFVHRAINGYPSPIPPPAAE